MPSSDKPTRIFVYGSLLRGEVHHAQLRAARFVGEARTQACYELVDLGDYPALVERGRNSVAGELYDVDGELLAALDAFEEAPDVYQRRPISLVGATAEGYVMPETLARDAARIPSGDWRKR